MFFVDNGFARLALDEHEEEGELVFLESQLHKILNLDESEVSTNGTTKLAGGRPVTELLALKTTLPIGATASGWPIPPHFQMMSKADNKNR